MSRESRPRFCTEAEAECQGVSPFFFRKEREKREEEAR